MLMKKSFTLHSEWWDPESNADESNVSELAVGDEDKVLD
jgi:hypothetical protein